MPWARALFEQLEQVTPADFAAVAEAMTVEGRHASLDAVAAVERTLERAEQLFLWGHWDAERYDKERRRLKGIRDELRAVESEAPIQLQGLFGA